MSSLAKIFPSQSSKSFSIADEKGDRSKIILAALAWRAKRLKKINVAET